MRGVRLFLLMFLSGLALSLQSKEANDSELFDDSLVSAVEYPGWFKRSFMDLPEDLREAGAAGKRGIMIVFGTQGCAYCKALVDRVLSDVDVQGLIRRHFDAIALEMFSDIEMVGPKGMAMQVKRFVKRERATFSPTVIFYDLNGNPVFRMVGYYPRDRFKRALDYVIEEAYRIQTFKNYLNNEPGGPMRSEESKRAGWQASSGSIATGSGPDRPTLIIFEAAGCETCRRFQQYVLSDQEIATTLQAFDIQRVDIDTVLPVKTRDNRFMPAISWMSALDLTRLPALAFYDRENKLVLQTDAEVGRQRMRNVLGYVLTGAYAQGMSYQQYVYQQRVAKKSSR